MVGGLSIGGLVHGGLSRLGGGLIDEQVLSQEACVAFAALRVQDPESGATTRRSVPVASDQRLGALADDVTTQADPRSTSQLEPDAGRLRDRGLETAGEPGRLEDQEQGLGASSECAEPVEPIGDARRSIGGSQASARQVEDEQVHGSSCQQASGDAQAFVERDRADDDEPFESNAPTDGLDRIETA